ncbi:MAG: stage II sporulation protein M [Candidatus Nezhaarchaeales archaeon]
MFSPQISYVKLPTTPIRMSLVLVSSMIFFLGIFIGYSSAHSLKSLVEDLEYLFSPLTGFPPIMLTVVVLVNNFIKTFLFMLLGILFAIPTVFFALINGVILGALGFFVAEEKGVLFLLTGLLPHGIFEIPALLISCALGIGIGMSVVRRIRRKDVSIGSVVISCIKAYFKIVMPLLVLAAFIEIYVTPLLLQQLL